LRRFQASFWWFFFFLLFHASMMLDLSVDAHDVVMSKSHPVSQRAFLSNASGTAKLCKRLAINDHGESWRGNASMHKVNEVTMKPFAHQHRNYKVPFCPIKGFGKINFYHEIKAFPRSESERMGNFLSNYNVIADASTFNKSLLRGMDVIRKMLF
jgi:hypothetical protein